MAYAAVVSLKHTLEDLVNSSNICLAPPSKKIIAFIYTKMEYLHEILKAQDNNRKKKHRIRKRLDTIEYQIRDAVSRFEDVIESNVSDQILKQSDNITGNRIQFSVQLQHLEPVIYSFSKKLTEIGEEYEYALRTPKLDFEDDDPGSALPTAPGGGGKKSRNVGLSDELLKVKEQLVDSTYRSGFRVTTLVGMAGIGKTTLARAIYEDPTVLNHFDRHFWVTVGKGRDPEEIEDIFLDEFNINKVFLNRLYIRDRTLNWLKESMAGKKYLFFLDDVWDSEIWTNLRYLFLDDEHGIQHVLQTTRLHSVADDPYYCRTPIKMRLLDKEESWDLFVDKVFAGMPCPSSLEKAGKKIAEKCDGLPLTIVNVADLLSRANKTPEYWSEVAEQKNHQLFVDAHTEISKVLYPSYTHLPQHLKVCFLYMGVFPRNYEVPQSYIFNLLPTDGLVEPNASQTLEDCVVDCLQELVSDTVLMVYKESTISLFGKGNHWKSTIGIKTCGLHSSFWYLCNREASKNKFFYVLDSLRDALREGIERQRRLCIHNNVLFGIKDVHRSIKDKCALTARSLLCFGPYHPYPVPICYSLLLLRELDALKIRFYEFPMEVLKLVQLRYLAITYNGKLPPYISKLWKLQVFIVQQHLSIKYPGGPMCLPLEIWDMKELKHLQVAGNDLHHLDDTLLPHLLTLSGVGAHSCTKGVLGSIPNLKKLGIQIELQPDVIEPLTCFDHISCLQKLESLKCVIVNPEHTSVVLPPPNPLPAFPSSLRKLTLSGLGYPWECINVIASVARLEVLKLRNNAFRGPKWEVKGCQFLRLKVLLVEDSDLVQWKGGASFPLLRRLSIEHCYKLEEFTWKLGTHIKKVELIDCNPLGVACAKQTIERYSRMSNPDVYVHCSWDDRKRRT